MISLIAILALLAVPLLVPGLLYLMDTFLYIPERKDCQRQM